jgi:hypothetical protein
MITMLNIPLGYPRLTVILAAWAALTLPSGAITQKDYGTVQSLQINVEPSESAESTVVLRGHDARQQVLVTGKYSSGFVEDFTHKVSYEVAPPEVLEVKDGVLLPRKNGEAVVTAKLSNGTSGTVKVMVKDFEQSKPINFGNQIVPIFTKAGCNAGGCHGKSGGQNGFKLSLLGFEPAEDYEYLVKEGKARRIFPAAPDRSLLLLKATATLPHGGGRRLDEGSDDYKLLARWISQGMPFGNASDPKVESIEVFPKERTMRLGGDQQLIVMAKYTDGALEDVTRSALYEPNDKNMAKTDATGEVNVYEQPGDVAVMIRYQAKVAVFRASLPLGAPVDKLPEPNNFVDQLVFKKLQTLGLPPSELCDDATFLRRSAIDIAGRLPSVEETKKFLSESDPKKREKWVEKLLSSADYAQYFANKWSSLLRNKRTDTLQARGTFAFYDWIRDGLMENKPYDQFVREILTASGDMAQNPPVAWYRQVSNPNMQLEDSAQLFLGLRLQCAQCHHHPFEKWSQNDYYSLAAVFSKVGRKPGSKPGEEVIIHTRGMPTAQNKKTKKDVQAAALGTPLSEVGPDDDARAAFADWMSSPKNPFFAKSLVNRYWKHFFNRGLVEPEDDMRETNPSTNPELLEAAAKYFVESGFDLKQLVRAICTSKTYQLSSLPNEYNKVDKQHYSRYFPKRLTAEVLYDAVNDTLHSESHFDGLPVATRATSLPDNSFNAASYFLTVFGRPDSSSACECERSQDASLAQSLHLLNSKEIQDKLSSDSGRAALLAKDEKSSEEEKLRELYLLAFSRPARDEELAFAKSYLEKKVAASDGKNTATLKRQAYEDILWAVINTKEFLFNH